MNNLVSIMVDIYNNDIRVFLDVISKGSDLELEIEYAVGHIVFDANEPLNIFSLDLDFPIELLIHYNTNDNYIKFLTLLNENKIKYEEV